MKRVLSIILLLIVTVSIFPFTAIAEYSYHSELYYQVAGINYRTFIENPDSDWNQYYKVDENFMFAQMYNDSRYNHKNLAKWVAIITCLMDGVSFSSTTPAEMTKVEYYETALLSLLQTMENEISTDLDAQLEVDQTMSIEEYMLKAFQIVAGNVIDGETDFEKFNKLIWNGYTVTGDVAIAAAETYETVGTVAELQAVQKNVRIYKNFKFFLDTIKTNTSVQELRIAAENVSADIDSMYLCKARHLSDYIENDVLLDYASYFFDEFIDTIIDDAVISDSILAVISGVKTGQELGSFAGDILVGGHDVFLRYYEILSMGEIRECLISEIEKEIAVIGSNSINGNNHSSFEKIQSYLYDLLYVTARGEYCFYSLMKKDAKLANLIHNAPDLDGWYQMATNLIQFEKSKISIMLPYWAESDNSTDISGKTVLVCEKKYYSTEDYHEGTPSTVWYYSYDQSGNLISMDEDFYGTHRQYPVITETDTTGKITRKEIVGDRITTYQYDSAGNVIVETTQIIPAADIQEYSVRYTYDADNRLQTEDLFWDGDILESSSRYIYTDSGYIKETDVENVRMCEYAHKKEYYSGDNRIQTATSVSKSFEEPEIVTSTNYLYDFDEHNRVVKLTVNEQYGSYENTTVTEYEYDEYDNCVYECENSYMTTITVREYALLSDLVID